jgi:hypothetical protein
VAHIADRTSRARLALFSILPQSGIVGRLAALPRSGRFGRNYLAGKTVAVADNGLNTATLRPVVIEDMPQLRYLHVEIGFLDHSSWPDGRQQLIFRNQFSSPADQQREKSKRSRAERDWRNNPGLIHPAQTTSAPVEPKTLKLENVSRTEPVHAIVLPQLSAGPEDTALGSNSM